MICTVKEKLCAAGNGTEFFYNKMIMVYGVMVQNIVFLKPNRVIDKIIVHRIISNHDGWVCNGVF